MLRCQTRWIGVRCGVLGSGSAQRAEPDPNMQAFSGRNVRNVGSGSVRWAEPDPRTPHRTPIHRGLTSKHRVWFCPLGGTRSSPGLTRTKLLQDTIKQYPALCASFFLNTIPYYPSKLSQPLLRKTLIEEDSASRYIYIYIYTYSRNLRSRWQCKLSTWNRKTWDNAAIRHRVHWYTASFLSAAQVFFC